MPQTETVQRLFNGKDWRLCVDQYGNKVYAKTAKELKQSSRMPGKLFKIYVDRKGKQYHVGYGVGKHWFDVWGSLSVEVSISH